MTKQIKKKLAITFEKDSRLLPFIKFRIIGADGEYLALVDSGSEATLLDSKTADELTDNPNYKEYEGDSMTLNGLGGSVQEGQGKLFSMQISLTDKKEETWNMEIWGARMDMEHMQCALMMCSSNHPVSMLIGSDTLQRMNAKIDFAKKHLEVCGYIKEDDGSGKAE